MRIEKLPLSRKQLKTVRTYAKRYRLPVREVIVVACLSYFDGYEGSPEAEGYFLEARRKFLGDS